MKLILTTINYSLTIRKYVFSDHIYEIEQPSTKERERRKPQILSSSASSAHKLCELISSSYVFQKIIKSSYNLPLCFVRSWYTNLMHLQLLLLKKLAATSAQNEICIFSCAHERVTICASKKQNDQRFITITRCLLFGRSCYPNGMYNCNCAQCF
jgi:hypothetical protein